MIIAMAMRRQPLMPGVAKRMASRMSRERLTVGKARLQVQNEAQVIFSDFKYGHSFCIFIVPPPRKVWIEDAWVKSVNVFATCQFSLPMVLNILVVLLASIYTAPKRWQPGIEYIIMSKTILSIVRSIEPNSFWESSYFVESLKTPIDHYSLASPFLPSNQHIILYKNVWWYLPTVREVETSMISNRRPQSPVTQAVESKLRKMAQGISSSIDAASASLMESMSEVTQELKRDLGGNEGMVVERLQVRIICTAAVRIICTAAVFLYYFLTEAFIFCFSSLRL